MRPAEGKREITHEKGRIPVGEKVQQLRAHTALADGWGSIPSIYLAAHTAVPEDPTPTSDPQDTKYACDTHIYIWGKYSFT